MAGDKKRKGKKGRKGKKKKPQLSPEEQRRLELQKWQAVRPQLLAERIAQSKIEMPYFLQVEYALMADNALAKREQDKRQKRDQDLAQKQSKDQEHFVEVTERNLDRYEQRFQRALDNWLRVEKRMEDLKRKNEQKLRDINKELYLRKQEACRRSREQELQDKLRFKEEARVSRILAKKYGI